MAAATPPPAPSSDTVATCAEPANVVIDMTIAATALKPDARARTPKLAPSTNAAGNNGAATRNPLPIGLAYAAQRPLGGEMNAYTAAHLDDIAAEQWPY